MDKETAEYIFKYFFNLSSRKEMLAWKHHSSILKLEDSNHPKSIEIYKKKGWITHSDEILELLKDGYDVFEMNTAKNIIALNPDRVYLNNCPKCNRLARTPSAKQCRYCGFNWHQ